MVVPIVFVIFCVAVYGQNTSMNVTDFGSSTTRSSLGGNDTVFDSNSTTVEPPLTSSPFGNNCSISIDKTSEDLQQALTLGYHMLFMIFSFRNASRTVSISVDTPQPLTWVHVSGTHGKGLLWLRQDFKMLSLTSLSYGVANLEIYISDSPEGCLNTIPASEIARGVKDLILNNLASDPLTNISWIGSEVCNARFRFYETGTEVYFVCCKKDAVFKTTCYELQRNQSMNFFLLCILVFPFIALMFAPLLIPVGLFKDEKDDVFFQHKVSSQLQIRVTKQSSHDRTSNSPLEISKKYFKDMPRFCSTIATLNENVTYECTLEKIYFYVDRDNLIGKDTDPFGPVTMLYDLLSQYELKRRSFGDGNSLREYMTILFGKIMNTGYLLFIIILVNIPIILNLLFLFLQVTPAWYITNSLGSLGLNSNIIQYNSFGVSFFPRMELYFTYLVLIGLFVLVQFFKIRGTHRADVVIEILKQCLRDSRKRRIKLAFQTIYKACRSVVSQKSVKGWLLGFVYFVLFLPFVVFNFVFYLLPTVNLVCSIPIYLFTYVLSNKCGCLSRSECVRTIAKNLSDGLGLNPIFLNQADGEVPNDDDNDEEDSSQCSPSDMLIILILVSSLPVLIFVALDTLSFFIDIVIYVLVGLLLNASVTTTYVIISLMLVFYTRDLFDNVAKTYIKFNNTIIGDAMTKTREDVHKVALLNENLQKNTAFQLIAEASLSNPDAQTESNLPNDNFKLSQETGVLLWRTKRLIFFLDRKDTPYIPRKYFTKTSVMDCAGTPGPLVENLRTVTLDILNIFIFLFFIILVALAFSEETATPGTNQTLAVIAGGLIPWLLRTVLKAPAAEGVDVENLHFREVINDVIKNYEETWPVADIEIASVQVSENQPVDEVELIESEERDASNDSHEIPGSEASDSTDRELSTRAITNVSRSSRSPKAESLKHQKEETSSSKHNHLVVLVNKKSTRSQPV